VNIQRPNLFLGCITGTSVDGLDIALIRIADSQSIAIERAETVPLPDKLRKTLLELGQPGADDLDQTGYCDIELGHFIGEAINSLLHRWGLKPTDIAAIGSHGQTIRHQHTDRRSQSNC
jgi:anhydro-N-acetylmuramic acid kinase